MIDLPASPGPAESQPFALDFGNVRVPPLGGRVQRINRTGNRYAIELTLPAMSPADARTWSAALTRALRVGARWPLRQLAPFAHPGAVLVQGGAQLGTLLAVDGGTPGTPYHPGHFVSILTGGRRYLHQLGLGGAINPDGIALLTLAEPLRVAPADNSPVEFSATIEGLIAGEGGLPLPRITAARLASPLTIRIEEMG